MHPGLVMPDIDVAAGAEVLRSGELVAFPTETVYGLGADASNPAAVAKIFAMKGRPADHPLIVHLAETQHLCDFAVEIPAAARKLAAAFWPGPLTMILRKSPAVPAEVTGGQETVGIRVPSHPLARALLREFNRVAGSTRGVAAPSANRFGHVSPTSAAHVRDEFGPELAIVDGEDCPVGLESTIVDLSRGEAVLLRPGAITRSDLESTLTEPVRARDAQAPRASGTLAAHYAPRTVLRLVDARDIERLARADEAAVLATRPAPAGLRVAAWIEASPDPARYAHDLYANLRRLDASGARHILVEAPPAIAAWEAINDRLQRAASADPFLDDEP